MSKKHRNRNKPAQAPSLALQEKTPRFLGQLISPWEEQMGVEPPQAYALRDLLGSYGEGRLANVWVYRAVRAKADAVAQLALLFQERARNNKKEEWTTILEGAIPTLFADINPIMSYYDYGEAIISFLELTGNCFLALENPSPTTKLPREIWPIRPDIVRPHPDDETGEILGYTVHLQTGKPLLYRADEMIHAKYFNPTNWYWGLSPLSAHRLGLAFNYYVGQYESNFFRHGVREGGILVTKESLNNVQFERLRRQVESRYGGVEQMHRPMLLESGLDWKRITVPPKDMEYLAMRRWNKDEVGAAFGVPPLKLMDLKEASVLANADTQERIFWSDAVIPLLRKLEGYYAEFLLPLFLSPKERPWYRLVFDLSSIRAFQLDEKGKSEVASKLVSGPNPIMSVNEVRDRLYDMPPAPWGAEPLVPAALVPVSMLGGGRVEVQEALASAIADRVMGKFSGEAGSFLPPSFPPGGAKCPPLPPAHKNGAAEDPETCEDVETQAKDPFSEEYIRDLVPEFEVSEEHQLYWRDWAVKRLKEEDRFTKALNIEFRRELSETLAALDNYEGSQELLSASSLLFDEERAIGEMKDLYQTQFGFIFRAATAEEIADWGLVNAEQFDSPTVLEYGRSKASWFAGPGRTTLAPGQYPGVTGTQLNNLERALNAGLARGESIPELTKRVQQVFAGSIREKGYAARRIARTETIRLANWTRLVQFQRNSDVISGRQWIAQLDSRVEEICARLHGDVADLGKAFNGGYMQPPDPHVS